MTEEQKNAIEAKIAELEKMYQDHFNQRYVLPDTESGNVAKAVSIALAKERQEFIEFLRGL